MDYNFLNKLFQTKSESETSSLVQQELKRMNIGYKTDMLGNIYKIDIPNSPLLSAHMDTVQRESDIEKINKIKITTNKITGKGIIGADDKCGIYIILQLLKEFNINFLFSVQEEVGGFGSSYFISNNDISHIPYGLILDRHGSSDIICTHNGYGTKELENDLLEIGQQFGFRPETGIWSDADNLSNQISCANISVGYYNEHTKKEYVNLDETRHTLSFIRSILMNLENKYEMPFNDIYPFGYCDVCGDSNSEVIVLESALGLSVCPHCFNNLKNEIFMRSEDRYMMESYYG